MARLDSSRRLLFGLLFLIITLAAGTLGFTFLEGWTPFDALYATVLIVATLGFGPLHPLSPGGKVLTLVLIVAGVGVLFSLLVSLAEGVLENIAGTREKRRMKRRIDELTRHVIVCGYGRVGQEVVRELLRDSHPLLVIEPDEAQLRSLVEMDIPFIRGDASRDDVLREAGIERARGVVVCTSSDAINVFVTLSARALNPHVFIAARALNENDEAKLLLAGANRAITPTSLGGRRLANLILRPTVMDLIEVLVHSGELEMWLEEIVIDDRAELENRSIADVRLADGVGVTILAVKRANGKLIAKPPPTMRLHAGDVVVALGTREELNRLEELSE
jgi:voltage-gated potassium channel